MATNDLEISEQSIPDECGIDYSKVDLLKSLETHIYDLFKVSIEYDSSVKSKKTTPTKNMTQWIALYGEKQNRCDAKEYIKSFCNPECTRNISKTKEELDFIEKDNFIIDLIKEHKIFIEVDRAKCLIVIKGYDLSVAIVESIIENKFQNYYDDESDRKFQASPDNDSVICLSDDPYEVLDMPKSKTVTPVKIKTKVADDIQNSLEQLNVSPKPANVHVVDHKELLSIGLDQGYTLDEIQKAITHFATPKIGETEFLNYLKSNRESYLLKMTNSAMLFESTEKYENKKLNSNNKTRNISPFKSPVSKRLHLIDEKEQSDAESIVTIPKTIVNQQKKQVFEEYAKMLEINGCDETAAKDNKQKRLIKLASALPSDEQQRAFNQIDKFKTKTEQIPIVSSKLQSSTLISTNDDELDKNLIWNNNITNENKPKPPLSPRSVFKTNPNYSNNHVYNPQFYTSYTNDDVASNSQFTNFDNDTQIKSSSYKELSVLNIKNNNNNNTKSQLQPFKKPIHLSSTNKNNSNINGKNNSRIRSKSSSVENDNETRKYIEQDQAKPKPKNNLRPIFIDGSNVARDHGKRTSTFSCKGIQIVVDYFLKRGHERVEAYVPRYRRGSSDKLFPTVNPEILDRLDTLGILKYTPSRSYDDRFFVIAALHYDGIIVSNDQYRDLYDAKTSREAITNRCLQFVFSDDLFIPAEDPLGRHGPRLDKFLQFPTVNQTKSNNNLKTNTSTEKHLNNQKSNHHQNNKNDNKNKQMVNRRDLNSTPTVKNNLPINNQNNVHIPPSSAAIANVQVITTDIPKFSNIRSVAQTTELHETLSIVFEKHENTIRKLLNQYPTEHRIEFFSTILIEEMEREKWMENN